MIDVVIRNRTTASMIDLVIRNRTTASMIETRRLKNVLIFTQTILSFALSRKILNI